MPLFLYKCPKCEEILEQFVNGNDADVICEKCKEKCERQLNLHNNRTQLRAKEFYNDKVAPEVKRISKELDKEKDSTVFDIFGEK